MRRMLLALAVLAGCSAPSPSGVAPVLTGIDLAQGYTEGGAPRRLTGAHLDRAAKVKFGGIAATATWISATTLDVTTPAHPAGAVSITVTNPDGRRATLPGGFTYLARAATPGCRTFSQLRPPGCPAKPAHFELDRPGATSVQLAGEFTGWQSGALPMQDDGSGRFTLDVALRPGEHEYKFIVDGTWIADPNAPTEPIFGNSVIDVVDACLPSVSLTSPSLGAHLASGKVDVSATITPGQASDGTPRTIPADGIVLCVDDHELTVARAGNTLTGSATVGPGQHRVAVQVRDAGGFTSTTAWALFTTGSGTAPIADAGPVQSLRLGDSVILDGAGSYDPSGLPLASWKWTELDGPETIDASTLPDGHVTSPVGYNNDPQAMPPTTPARKEFTPTLPGVYTFRLDVRSQAGKSASSTTQLIVLPQSGPRPQVRLSLTAPQHGLDVAVDARGSTFDPGATFDWLADARNPVPLDLSKMQAAGGQELIIPRSALSEGVWRFWVWIEEGGGASGPGMARVTMRDGRVRVDNGLTAPAWAYDTTIDEIFVRHFYDSDGDGIGDLNGVTEKLDYLKGLGIQTLWLMPVFVCNDHDHGYHTTDYLDVDPDLGTRADLLNLIRQAHARGMKIVLDLAINHTSRRHPFFLASLHAFQNPGDTGPDSFFRDFYIWFDNGPGSPLLSDYGWGREQGGSRLSLADGWADIPDIDFGHGQPRRYYFDVAHYWADPNGDGDFSDGVDGFRLDHVTGPDKVIWTALRSELKAENPDLLVLGEVFRDFDNGGQGFGIKDYYWGQLDAAFTFPLYWDFQSIFQNGAAPMATLQPTLDDMQSDRFPPGALHIAFLENHDVPTGTTAFDVYGEQKMIAALTLEVGLPAAPQAIWGQELGSTVYRGFPPWEKEGPDNALENRFRAAMSLRLKSDVLRHGAFAWIPTGDENEVASFVRMLPGSAPVIDVVNTSANAASIVLDLSSVAQAGTMTSDVGDLSPAIAGGHASMTLPPYAGVIDEIHVSAPGGQ